MARPSGGGGGVTPYYATGSTTTRPHLPGNRASLIAQLPDATPNHCFKIAALTGGNSQCEAYTHAMPNASSYAPSGRANW